MRQMDSVVSEMMAEFGFFATYVQRVNGGYDTATGENTIIATEIPIRAILMDLTLRANGLGDIPGTLIQEGDKELYVQPPNKNIYQAITVNPASDVVKINGTEYKIVTMKEINTTGSDATLYCLYIRK
jgi:hypothetical protein